MISYTYDLDMVPGGRRTEVPLNQYDEDFELNFNLFARNGVFEVQDDTTVAIRGTKPDGNGFSADATIDGNTVTVVGDQQMTVVAGRAAFELTLYKGEKELNTANFTINVERAALDKDTVHSRSQTRELVEIEDNADEIIAAAQQASAAQEAIAASAHQVEVNAATAVAAMEAAQAAQSAIDSNYETYMGNLEEKYTDTMHDIDEKAAAIAQLTTDADTVARRALEKATNAENETAEFANDVDSMKRQVNSMRLMLEGKVDDAFVENGYLYMSSNGEVIVGPLGPFSGGGGGGGGGDGGNNALLSVTNVTGWLSTTIADGDDCPVSILWSSIEDEMPTGDGTAKITVNGAVKAMLNVTQGTVNINLAPYCSTGVNVVKVTISDVYDNSRTINFSINCIAISLSSSFDATTPYMGAISFPYTPVGNVSKTLKFLLDGQLIGTNSTSVSGRQMSFTIPQQSHGAHTFEAYFECEINGQIVESNHLYYEIICLEPLNTEPIIVSSFKQSTAPQYTTAEPHRAGDYHGQRITGRAAYRRQDAAGIYIPRR